MEDIDWCGFECYFPDLESLEKMLGIAYLGPGWYETPRGGIFSVHLVLPVSGGKFRCWRWSEFPFSTLIKILMMTRFD